MLDNTDLVHMNGRVFDPVVGRFVSSDPNYDCGLKTQGWNRYSYVGNKTLSATDPTGFDIEEFTSTWYRSDLGYMYGGNRGMVEGFAFDYLIENNVREMERLADLLEAPVLPPTMTEEERQNCQMRCGQLAHDTARPLASIAGSTVAGLQFGPEGGIAGFLGSALYVSLTDSDDPLFPTGHPDALAGLLAGAAGGARDVGPGAVGSYFEGLAGQMDNPGPGIVSSYIMAGSLAELIRGVGVGRAFATSSAFGALGATAYMLTYWGVYNGSYDRCVAQRGCE
jgi:RHS repeat-associated protein